jgi:hypothetical protein
MQPPRNRCLAGFPTPLPSPDQERIGSRRSGEHIAKEGLRVPEVGESQTEIVTRVTHPLGMGGGALAPCLHPAHIALALA